MDGKRSRKRRVVRAMMLSLLIPLLLLAGYISTWIAVSRAARENFLSQDVILTLRPVFAPLIRFCESESPGGAELNRFWWRINPRKVVQLGDSWIEDATSALVLAPSDGPRRVGMDDPKVDPQPVSLPQPIRR